MLVIVIQGNVNVHTKIYMYGLEWGLIINFERTKLKFIISVLICTN